VFSVGAVDMLYNRWNSWGGGSNYGRKLNIWAPGKEIHSSWVDADDPTDIALYKWNSGTSMATPHVAGVMALFMGYEGYQNLPNAEMVYDRIRANQIDAVYMDDRLLGSGTTTMLLQNGMRNELRSSQHPYDGIPDSEVDNTGNDTDPPPTSSVDST
jgi:subtilisin family serine protease